MIREGVRGYGRAYKRGFAVATGDLIITLDGDHSYPVDALSYLIEAFLHLDVDFLNASRFPVRDAQAMSLKHKIGNLMLSAAMSVAGVPAAVSFASLAPAFAFFLRSASCVWLFARCFFSASSLSS